MFRLLVYHFFTTSDLNFYYVSFCFWAPDTVHMWGLEIPMKVSLIPPFHRSWRWSQVLRPGGKCPTHWAITSQIGASVASKTRLKCPFSFLKWLYVTDISPFGVCWNSLVKHCVWVALWVSFDNRGLHGFFFFEWILSFDELFFSKKFDPFIPVVEFLDIKLLIIPCYPFSVCRFWGGNLPFHFWLQCLVCPCVMVSFINLIQSVTWEEYHWWAQVGLWACLWGGGELLWLC